MKEVLTAGCHADLGAYVVAALDVVGLAVTALEFVDLCRPSPSPKPRERPTTRMETMPPTMMNNFRCVRDLDAGRIPWKVFSDSLLTVDVLLIYTGKKIITRSFRAYMAEDEVLVYALQ